MKKMKVNKKGFTLIEMLVVVLIIGILAAIALPQYQMAVTKAKVASMLPLMRRWYDALAEYKLQHGDYGTGDNYPNGATLGVSWPSDWDDGTCGDNEECFSNGGFWHDCFANEDFTGAVYCNRDINNNSGFQITMYQPDESNFNGVAGKMVCEAYGTEGQKICKALGGKLLSGVSTYYDYVYAL